MIPVISVVASQSKMGKTTVLCKIIEELKLRGYRVATIKHHKGDFEIDQPGKDTWNHYKSGSDLVIMSTPLKFAKIERLEEEYKLDEIIEEIDNVDIILTEGYKYEAKPKIEIIREEISRDLISPMEELIGIVTNFKMDNNIPQFAFDQVKELIDMVELRFLYKGR